MARGGIKLTSAFVFDSVRAPILRTLLQERNNAVGIVTRNHEGPECALGISFDDSGVGAEVGNETIAENLEGGGERASESCEGPFQIQILRFRQDRNIPKVLKLKQF